MVLVYDLERFLGWSSLEDETKFSDTPTGKKKQNAPTGYIVGVRFV